MHKRVEAIWQLATKHRLRLTKILLIMAVAVLLSGVWAWWRYVHSSPRRVFWGAIDNALRLQSFVRTSSQTENGQTFVQQTYNALSPEQVINGSNQITQSGSGGFDVGSELIGTPKDDYVRYTAIKTDQMGKDGKPLDYSAVLQLWGKSQSTDGQTTGQAYNQSVLGGAPFGNVVGSKRKELIAMMQEKPTYTVDFSKVARRLNGGRPTYTYDVTVNPEAYITVLKAYARLAGLTQLEASNPEEFRNASPLEFRFTIDVWTHRLVKVEYANGRIEEFSGYGLLRRTPEIPTETISVDELQQRVQSVE